MLYFALSLRIASCNQRNAPLPFHCRFQLDIFSLCKVQVLARYVYLDAGLWEVKARPPPKVKAPTVTIYLDDSESQILSPDSFYAHPDYPIDSYLS